METAFHYDPKEKQLSFLLRENVTADPDIQLRLRGRLNTATGGLEYHATAQKFLSTGTAIKVCIYIVRCSTYGPFGLHKWSASLSATTSNSSRRGWWGVVDARPLPDTTAATASCRLQCGGKKSFAAQMSMCLANCRTP